MSGIILLIGILITLLGCFASDRGQMIAGQLFVVVGLLISIRDEIKNRNGK